MSDHWRVGSLVGQQGPPGRLLGSRFTATDSTIAHSTRAAAPPMSRGGVPYVVTLRPPERSMPRRASREALDCRPTHPRRKERLMPFYERGEVRIHYEEAGSGFPLLLIPGGGLNSTIAHLKSPFDAIEEFKGEYRCIAADLRNANGGKSSGPLDIDR